MLLINLASAYQQCHLWTQAFANDLVHTLTASKTPAVYISTMQD